MQLTYLCSVSSLYQPWLVLQLYKLLYNCINCKTNSIYREHRVVKRLERLLAYEPGDPHSSPDIRIIPCSNLPLNCRGFSDLHQNLNCTITPGSMSLITHKGSRIKSPRQNPPDQNPPKKKIVWMLPKKIFIEIGRKKKIGHIFHILNRLYLKN